MKWISPSRLGCPRLLRPHRTGSPLSRYQPRSHLVGGPHSGHSVDAAQTFVVCLLASLRTVELRRSHVHALRRRDDGSTAVVGFCAGGKSPKGQADWQPFFWYVDSNMGVTGTASLWLYDWAKQRLGKQWIFPEYSLPARQKDAGAPWNRPGTEYWLDTTSWGSPGTAQSLTV